MAAGLDLLDDLLARVAVLEQLGHRKLGWHQIVRLSKQLLRLCVGLALECGWEDLSLDAAIEDRVGR